MRICSKQTIRFLDWRDCDSFASAPAIHKYKCVHHLKPLAWHSIFNRFFSFFRLNRFNCFLKTIKSEVFFSLNFKCFCFERKETETRDKREKIWVTLKSANSTWIHCTNFILKRKNEIQLLSVDFQKLNADTHTNAQNVKKSKFSRFTIHTIRMVSASERDRQNKCEAKNEINTFLQR